METQKDYYIILDTEGANGLDEPIVYDFGFAVVDANGEVYHTESMVIYDTFFNMPDVMESAYYADKIPLYYQDIDDGFHRIATWYTARKVLHEVCEKWNVKAIAAHNMFYDNNACNTTQRFLTCSKYRYFFPFGVALWDTLKMARDVICKEENFISFCKENNLMNGKGQPSASAENLYKYLTNNVNYKEEHTALEDVLIEKEIFAYCMKHNKGDMRKDLFHPREYTPPTEIQKQIMTAVRKGHI